MNLEKGIIPAPAISEVISAVFSMPKRLFEISDSKQAIACWMPDAEKGDFLLPLQK